MPPGDRTSPYLGVPFSVDRVTGARSYFRRDQLVRRDWVGAAYLTLQKGDTLHQIAFNVYGNAQWWWILRDYNEIVDPTQELPEGEDLLIPPLTSVLAQRA